jgi:hypothetical protein
MKTRKPTVTDDGEVMTLSLKGKAEPVKARRIAN